MSVDETKRQLLADPKAFVDNQQWITLIQDLGEPLTQKERHGLNEARAKSKKKSFKERILADDRLHSNLYKLAKMLYHTYNLDDKGGKWFKNLPKNPSEPVHKIGKWLASNRTKVRRPDIHSHQSTDLTEAMRLDGFKDRKVYYYLPQREALSYFFSIWGVKMDDLMRPTVDDKVRLLGILLTIEEMREYIPDILSKRRGDTGWRAMDAATGLSRAAWPLLLEKFIDEEVNITLPVEFFGDDMRREVDAKAGDGFYNLHSEFDPNNIERMKLPWNETWIKIVLKEARTAYEKMMTKYQKGTGGGPGAPENFVDWRNRHESYILDYTDQ